MGVCIVDEGGIKVVGVPASSDEFAIESAIGIVRDGGAEQLTRMLSRMPDKQAANLIATGSMVQRTAYVERVMDQSCPCQLVDGQIMAQRGCLKNFSTFLERRKNRRSSRRGAWQNDSHCYPTNVPRLVCQRGSGVSECHRQKREGCLHR